MIMAQILCVQAGDVQTAQVQRGGTPGTSGYKLGVDQDKGRGC